MTTETDTTDEEHEEDQHYPDYVWEDDNAWDFTATIEPEPFYEFVRAFNKVADEVLFEFDQHSISATVSDPARVVLMENETDCVRGSNGTCKVGVPVNQLLDGLPNYYSNSMENYTLTVMKEVEDCSITVSHPSEGTCEVRGFAPDSVRSPPEFPDSGRERSFMMRSRYARGIFHALASEADQFVMLREREGSLGAVSDVSTDDEWMFPDIEGYQDTSVFLGSFILTDLMEALPPSGDVTVYFDQDRPVWWEHEDGMTIVQAPRVDHADHEGVDHARE